MRLSTFIHQKSSERIVRKVRRHPVTLVPALVVFVLLFAMPPTVRLLLLTLFPTTLQSLPPLFPSLIIIATSVYYLSVLLFGYSYFLDFYLDLLIITNHRIIDINQLGLMARRIAEVDLSAIQDMTSEIKGACGSLFNYGTLSVQTAGAVEQFIFHHIPHPETVRQEILDLAEENRKYHNEMSKS